MKIEEYYDSEYCDECEEYKFSDIFEIYVGDNEEYPKLRLCKSCLLKLLKAIIER